MEKLSMRKSYVLSIFSIIFLLCATMGYALGDTMTPLKPRFIWMEDKETFTVFLNHDEHVNHADVAIMDHLGESLHNFKITQEGARLTIKMDAPIHIDRNYRITINRVGMYAYYSKFLLDEYFDYTGELGPRFENQNVKLTVWSPPATHLEVIVYNPHNSNQTLLVKQLTRKERGVYEVTISPEEVNATSLDGYFYSLKVTAYGRTRFATDPYAKSLAPFIPADSFAKSAFVDLSKTDPTGFRESRKDNATLMISPAAFVGYEMHIRDFSIDPALSIKESERGTYLGVIKKIPYIQKLGVTHVQLMPVQSFYTVNELDKSFQHGGIEKNQINYNWGYDAHHYFAPEGWYSTVPTDPTLRILELKRLVKEFHDRGIGVIMDVVYNHTYDEKIFESIAPGCYLRMNAFGVISNGTGAGASLESRTKMVRRLIVDSLKYFQEEFHINGFRFDLMGFLDLETMRSIRQTLGSDAILYGEAWEFTDLPHLIAATKQNLPSDVDLAAFSDTTRDGISGAMASRGFIQSAHYEGPKVRAGIIGNLKHYNSDYNGDGHPDAFISTDAYQRFADSPMNTINYLAIHDGFTLWDKINLSVRASYEERKQLMRLAYGILLTSQGRIVLHGGDELGRSKPLSQNDPEPTRAHTSIDVTAENGITHFHENSYKSPDVTNMINWKRGEDFLDLTNYVKGLIELRKYFPPFRYETSKEVNEGLRFIAEDMPETPSYKMSPASLYTSWNQVETLRIQFKNGPRNKRIYLVGEIHEGDKNPKFNPYYIDLDHNGFGEFFFSSELVRSFDLYGWSNSNSLQLKVVYTPGEWDSPTNAYSGFGNNTIKLESIRFGNVATIDLSIIDHTAGEGGVKHQGHIAYFLKEFTPNAYYSKFLVIHNAEDHALELTIPELADFYHFDLLADGQKAGILPIIDSKVKREGLKVTIPSKASAIWGCK